MLTFFSKYKNGISYTFIIESVKNELNLFILWNKFENHVLDFK